jgi:hypothetical protein
LFGRWEDCSKSCGGGKQHRSRKIILNRSHGGRNCPVLRQERKCSGQACPKDCVMTRWSLWSTCSSSCASVSYAGKIEGEGGGTQVRKRSVWDEAADGGKKCGPKSATRRCNTFKCPIDCKASYWQDWGECSITCGGNGVTFRNRLIVAQAQFGGLQCKEEDIREKKQCSTKQCPVHCQVSVWKNTPCSRPCGMGSYTRTRSVVWHSHNSGYRCPALKETHFCHVHPCPQDCRMNNWSKWSTCTTTCGAGTHKRHRTIASEPKYGGKRCGPLVHKAVCRAALPCVADCVVSKFSAWTPCSMTCGPGTRSRSRKILEEGANGGKRCPALQQRMDCDADICPVDCKLSKWSVWSKCSKTCGEGTLDRSRTIISTPTFDGKTCGAQTQRKSCYAGVCPVDCVMGSFSKWSLCSRTCDGGHKARTRKLISGAQDGGKRCGPVRQVASCNTVPCGKLGLRF